MILITGASGFLGLNLTTALSVGGYDVRGLVRRRQPHAVAGQTAVYDGHIDRIGIRNALSGVTTVVNLAGRAHVLDKSGAEDAGAFHEVNVEGTRILLEEAAAAGVNRIIHLSSVGAVAPTSAERISETTTPNPTSAYGASKLASEIVVREVCARHSISYAILRPPMIYGAGMKGNPLRLFDLVAKGVPLPFGSVNNRRSVLFVGNLVAAVKAILATGRDLRETLVVGEGRPVSTPELVRSIATALGVEARLLPAPEGLLRIAARAGDFLAQTFPFPLTTRSLEQLLGSLEVDYARIADVIGYRPEFTMEEGMRMTAEWYVSRGK